MTGKPKFTPGPWRGTRSRQFGTFAIETATEEGVCELYHLGSTEQSEANAHLIAAAPELFRALQAASHALKSYQHGNTATDLAADVAAFADAALAKAEGRA